jgi:hypothetical protein
MTARDAVLAMALTMMSSNSSPAQISAPGPPQGTAEHLHVVNTFRFEVAASMQRVAPLFAPKAERSWAGEDWNSVFQYPQPGRDVPGAVWTVKHGPFNSVWGNTLFDVPGGRMQYVAVIGDHLVQTVDVHVTALGLSRTAVEVTYALRRLPPRQMQMCKLWASAIVRAGRSGSAALNPRWD